MPLPDRTVPPLTPEALLERLGALGIAHVLHRHPPLRTVEEAKALRGALPGGHVKNLFLKDKKDRLVLLTVEEDSTVDLKAVPALLGLGRVSFASPERLWRHLGILPGAVSPLALANDAEGLVAPVLERRLLDHALVNLHPLDNRLTVALAPSGLLRFLESLGRAPRLLDLA